MKTFFAIFFLAASMARSQAGPPTNYYSTAFGKTGADLRNALHLIIRNHHNLPYSGTPHPNTSDAFAFLDRDPLITNNVLGIYSDFSIVATNIGSSSNSWNREHMWCQSFGADVGPPHTDLHHMRPESAPVNSSRGNNFYDVSLTNAPGYKASTNPLTGWVWSRTSTTWEPPDQTKGEIARGLLYMMVRYTGDKVNEPPMILTDNTNLITTTNTYMGRYTTLLKWHFEHPVTDKERVRNDYVYSLYQTNRNPFIDHPEWVAPAFIPPLQIAMGQTNLLLYWTNDYAPTFIIQESTNLVTAWLTLTNTPFLTNNNWTVFFNQTNSAHFYRLRLN